jgi:flagellar hook assembly protein FlgD
MKKIWILVLLSMIFFLSAIPNKYELTATYLSKNNWQITYTLPVDDENITLTVLGKGGTYIITLAEFKSQKAGAYTYFWDGNDENGLPVEGVSARFRTSANGAMKAILLK